MEISKYANEIEEAVKKYSEFYGIPISLIKAIIKQESSFDPFAIRVERGFWTRYLVGIKDLILRTKSKRDDYWMDYPDFVSASYGLCQIMLTVAIELGFQFQYPTQLLDIDTNIDFGCRKLRQLLLKHKSLSDVISSYNQGNPRKDSNDNYINQHYVDNVLKYMKEFEKGA